MKRCPPHLTCPHHIDNLPVSWGRSPTCPGIFSHLLRLLCGPLRVWSEWQNALGISSGCRQPEAGPRREPRTHSAASRKSPQHPAWRGLSAQCHLLFVGRSPWTASPPPGGLPDPPQDGRPGAGCGQPLSKIGDWLQRPKRCLRVDAAACPRFSSRRVWRTLMGDCPQSGSRDLYYTDRELRAR